MRLDRLAETSQDAMEWRHALHSWPETAFEEHVTAGFVEEKLRSFGFSVQTALNGTAVLARIGPASGKVVIFRAELDALPIKEQTGLPYRSKVEGNMHACGHDGHAAMLLGAARLIAETTSEAPGIIFLFQPAEERGGGANALLQSGFLDDLDVEAIFGLHNWPGLPTGQFAVRPGPVMAASDTFLIRVVGVGSHAAMPHEGSDPLVAACQLVASLQSIVSRRVDPTKPVTISVTQVHGGTADNVIPSDAIISGTIRTFDDGTRTMVKIAIEEMAIKLCGGFGCAAEVGFTSGYPAVNNSAGASEFAARCAALANSETAVNIDYAPSMGTEDFSYYLQRFDGAYAWLGAGADPSLPRLHSPYYDFNDELIPYGIKFWWTLAKRWTEINPSAEKGAALTQTGGERS